MTVSIMTSREFNQDSSRAKRAAKAGPVFITERGKRSHVLLSMSDYDRIVGRGPSIADLLAHPESAHIEFDPEPMRGIMIKPVDFS
jgi:prevent-host-death family protein